MKKIILGVMIGILLCSGIVYATSYLATDVSYSPEANTWNVSNVNEALNDLYEMSTLGDATAEDILEGKTALIQGELVTGTAKITRLTCTYSGDKVEFPEETELLIFYGSAGNTEADTNSGASSPRILLRETGTKSYKVITTSSNSVYAGTVTVTVDWDNNYMTRPTINQVLIYASAYGIK